LEKAFWVGDLSQRSHGEDISSSWSYSYIRWRPKLRAAHEAVWIGARFVGGGVALGLGHLSGGLVGKERHAGSWSRSPRHTLGS
jgi:hypothetical protein